MIALGAEAQHSSDRVAGGDGDHLIFIVLPLRLGPGLAGLAGCGVVRSCTLPALVDKAGRRFRWVSRIQRIGAS